MGAVYLVRHGQASFGKSDYDALSETGFEQARVLGESLRSRLPRPDALFTGSLRRHRETAEACQSTWGVDLKLQSLPGFDEFDQDELIRLHTPRYADPATLRQEVLSTADPRRAFQELFTQAVARWVSGQHDAEYKETWSAFRQRCTQSLDTVLKTLGPSATGVVFTSGGPITAVCQELLHLPDEHAFRINWMLTNCGVTKLIYSERGRYLSTLNEHSHFEGARRALITYR
ncbi:phosphoglycerate mutase [Cystobacter fuscus]|uniref:Phosphoglycerate mutase n=1 Tax=Cystobacter fuscus TaxID=43 RepID=A0A250J686_9BACT|nr:histidine phosphatase family protein [Cystobacter fuscus]ATB39048.1 phosphoglycerate mutase [Cystobacter fuscus]